MSWGLAPFALSVCSWAARLWYAGRARLCPICGARVRCFLPHRGRPDARCPVCRSLERHRLIWLFFQRRTDLLDGRPKSLLHIAPEPSLSRWFSRTPNLRYVTGDLASPWAQRRLDVTGLELPDASFDVVDCSHVLEHVRDDRRAMAELFRVMKPGGWGVIQVPIQGETTYEDPTIVSPEDRLRVFGQEDHVRIYGQDYPERLAEVGFRVTVERFAGELGGDERRHMGVMESEAIHICRRPPG